jgi:hypothetical protein
MEAENFYGVKEIFTEFIEMFNFTFVHMSVNI